MTIMRDESIGNMTAKEIVERISQELSDAYVDIVETGYGIEIRATWTQDGCYYTLPFFKETIDSLGDAIEIVDIFSKLAGYSHEYLKRQK